MVESLPPVQDISRKEAYQVMISIEEKAPTQSEDLEDITDLVFSACDELQDCELLAPASFDLTETMSAFELMDPKMDLRVKRSEVVIPAFDPTAPLSEENIIALMNRCLRETASWLSGA